MLHPALKQALVTAGNKELEAQAAVDVATEIMKSIHGGQWHAKIHHEARWIMIFQSGDEPASPRKEGI
jgi:hypothetical protein